MLEVDETGIIGPRLTSPSALELHGHFFVFYSLPCACLMSVSYIYFQSVQSVLLGSRFEELEKATCWTC